MPNYANTPRENSANSITGMNVLDRNPVYGVVHMSLSEGYYTPETDLMQLVIGLTPDKIKAGTYVGNANDTSKCMLGTFTNDATATDPDVKSGKTYYRQGAKYTGSMPVNTGWRIVPWSNSNADTAVDVQYSAGYWDANIMSIQDPDLIPPNIIDSANIFGVQGSGATRYAQGTANTDANGYITVRGLNFQPKGIMLVRYDGGNLWYLKTCTPMYQDYNTYSSYGGGGGGNLYNTGSWTIYSDGFYTKVVGGNVTYNWYAYGA